MDRNVSVDNAYISFIIFAKVLDRKIGCNLQIRCSTKFDFHVGIVQFQLFAIF